MRLSLHREENGLSTARFDKERSVRLNDSVRGSGRSTSGPKLSSALKCFVGTCDKSATVKGCLRAPRRVWPFVRGKGLRASRSSHLLPNGKMVFQSLFMSTTVQPFAWASSSALSRRPILELRS